MIPTEAADRPPEGPLAGVVVVDLSRALAGPHASMLMGDLGARVIKVELPGRGDDTRSWGPPFVGPPDHDADNGEGEPGLESTYFLSCNRNKESITLDLRSAPGIATLRRLLLRADVLVENFRPGVMERLGLSATALREINPRLVILSISGFGQDGPEGERAGYDQIVQGEAGLMSLTGSQDGGPTKVGVPIADLLAGIYGVYGVLAALFERTTTGTGRVVRTSLLSSVIGVHAFQGTRWTVAGEVPPLSGDRHPSICPYGLFHCADSDMQLAVGSDQMWRSFAAEFGLAHPEWETNRQRVALCDEVITAVNAVFGKSTAEEVLARLDRIGVPAGRVRTLDQVYNWEQVRSQGLCLEVEHPTLGRITLPGNPLRFDENAHSGGRRDHAAPPLLGQHNDSVRAWLDATESESTDQEERSCAM